jgi:AraC-like DNA-binding protein
VKNVIYSEMMNGLVIDRVTRDSTYNMVKHWHPEYEIQYFVQGKRDFFIGDHNYSIKAGSLVLVDSEQVHNTATGDEVFHERILIMFEKDIFARAMQGIGIDLPGFFKVYQGVTQIPQVDQAYVVSILEAIAKEVKEKRKSYQIEVQLKLMELIVYLTRLKNKHVHEDDFATPSQKTSDLSYQVASYIRKNYMTVHSLDDVAGHFYLDKSYLGRQFKKTTGYTVNEYINIQKVQQAQRLLEDTTLAIVDIAKQSGYQNLTYFNRVFKKYTETSPLKYRKKKNAYKKGLRERNNL